MLRRPDLELALVNPIQELKENKFIIPPDKFNVDSIPVIVRDDRIKLITNSCKEPKATLTRVIQTAPNLYTLKKRLGYLVAFVEFVTAKARKQEFHKPRLNAIYLEKALHSTVLYVQRECFSTVSDSLQEGSPDSLEDAIKRLNAKTSANCERRHLKNLCSIRCLRPTAFSDSTLRIEGKLAEADLPQTQNILSFSHHDILLLG